LDFSQAIAQARGAISQLEAWVYQALRPGQKCLTLPGAALSGVGGATTPLSEGASVTADAEQSGETRPRRLQIAFCTRGGLFGALVLHRLQACEQIEICGIVRSSRNFHPRFGFLRGALAYIRSSGIAYSLYLLCATTLADWVCGFSAVGCVPTRSRAGNAPVLTTPNVNDPEALRFLRDCAPDLLVSAFFDQRLQEAVLAIPLLGCVNIHPSLLPSFKGVDPVLQARLHRADVGVTLHYMTAQLDAGEILSQRSPAIRPRASVFETTAILFREGAEMLVTQLERVKRREHGTPQSAAGSYQSWPSRADVRALRALGSVLIRFSDFRRLAALE
jgi:methionyl-tRNA formyltransferase